MGWFVYRIFNFIFYRHSTTPRTYAVILDKERRKVVVVRRWLDDGYLSFPGGGQKAGELPLRACLREVKEEIDLVFEPSELEKIHVVRHGQKSLVFYRYFLSERPLRHRFLELVDAAWINWGDKDALNQISYKHLAALKAATADLA